MESNPAGTAGPTDRESPRSSSLALVVVLAAALVLFGVLLVARFRDEGQTVLPTGSDDATSAAWTPAPRPEGQTVSMTIDFGNGARREFDALPWTEGLTLGQLMRRMADFRPALAYTQKGEGEMGFLTSLEGVANDGASGRYWFYAVDDDRGQASFDIQPLQPGARVLWVFKAAD